MAKIPYHAVLLDETRCEFGHTEYANSREEARDTISEMYPECRIVQLESPEDTRERERRMYARIEAEMNGGFYPEDEY